jgi:hypothetical protein
MVHDRRDALRDFPEYPVCSGVWPRHKAWSPPDIVADRLTQITMLLEKIRKTVPVPMFQTFNRFATFKTFVVGDGAKINLPFGKTQ